MQYGEEGREEEVISLENKILPYLRLIVIDNSAVRRA